jgi:hypothetical protein
LSFRKMACRRCTSRKQSSQGSKRRKNPVSESRNEWANESFLLFRYFGDLSVWCKNHIIYHKMILPFCRIEPVEGENSPISEKEAKEGANQRCQ